MCRHHHRPLTCAHHFWVQDGGIISACVNHGWAHAAFTKLGEWRQRRVKGRTSDRCIAGQRVTCTACRKDKREDERRARRAAAAQEAQEAQEAAQESEDED